ncbi:hypothetical protein [Bacillus sp. T33-2]|uniref:hypothetical protein n=1 Tax=Bacillus sp. T33-2 TaxID=2054168 RepID=UPI000C76830F|nr:hypothetical protein [Bacillus sp. T33-2]PLR94134.1 hypothetical protein CVD19_17785 [Bacillus sp. T33-2]
MKRYLKVFVILLAFAMPLPAAANGIPVKVDEEGINRAPIRPENRNAIDDPCLDGNERHRHMGAQGMHKHLCDAPGKEEVLEYVQKYNPKKLDQWKNAFLDRENLHKRWASPEMDAERKAWIEAKREEKQKIQNSYVKGDISLKEMRIKMRALRGTAHKRRMGNPFIYRDLQLADKAGRKQDAVKVLDEMLLQMKERNNSLRALIEEIIE